MSFLPWIATVLSALSGSADAGKKEGSSPGVRLPAEPSLELTIEGEAAGLLLHDLDGDGYLDLLVAANKGGRDGPSHVFLSRAGKFNEPSWTSGDQSVSAGIAAGDLDNDGIEDLVLSRYNHNPAVAYRGLGKGRFETKPFWESEDTEWAYGVLVGDFNGDGFADILTTQGIRMYRGGKDGPSKEAGWKSQDEFAEGKTCWVDLDHDGRKDLVVAHWMGPAITLHRGMKEEFDAQPRHVISEPGEFTGLAVGDLDGDGFPEVVVGARAGRMGDGSIRLYGNQEGRRGRSTTRKTAPSPSSFGPGTAASTTRCGWPVAGGRRTSRATFRSESRRSSSAVGTPSPRRRRLNESPSPPMESSTSVSSGQRPPSCGWSGKTPERT